MWREDSPQHYTTTARLKSWYKPEWIHVFILFTLTSGPACKYCISNRDSSEQGRFFQSVILRFSFELHCLHHKTSAFEMRCVMFSISTTAWIESNFKAELPAHAQKFTAFTALKVCSSFVQEDLQFPLHQTSNLLKKWWESLRTDKSRHDGPSYWMLFCRMHGLLVAGIELNPEKNMKLLWVLCAVIGPVHKNQFDSNFRKTTKNF